MASDKPVGKCIRFSDEQIAEVFKKKQKLDTKKLDDSMKSFNDYLTKKAVAKCKEFFIDPDPATTGFVLELRGLLRRS